MMRGRRSSRLAEKSEKACLDDEAEYWRRVRESNGFDVEHLRCPVAGLRVFKRKPDDYPVFLHLYAKMGLHQYNMINGTNLQLHHIEKYNRSYWPMPSSYYITLVAEDPSIGSLVTFQTSIHEMSANQFNVKCYIARPKSNETKCTPLDDANAPRFIHDKAPKWPAGYALRNKKNRLYLVQDSELQEHDWIRLYMELAFVTTNRHITNPKLSDLKIVKVVVDTKEFVNPPSEKLKGAKNANIYIEYEHDLGDGLFRKYRARITRSVDSRSGRHSLVGANQKLPLPGHDQEVTGSFSKRCFVARK